MITQTQYIILRSGLIVLVLDAQGYSINRHSWNAMIHFVVMTLFLIVLENIGEWITKKYNLFKKNKDLKKNG